LHFAELGAHIVVNFFRNRRPAEETAASIRELDQEALVVKAHIGTDEGLDHLFNQIENHFGVLDFLVSNAASGYNRPALQQKPKSWDWTMNINARALLFAAQRAVPLMKKQGGGAIVSISSPGSYRVLPDYAVVGASKAALEALTRYLAVELAAKNIVVNAVSPGIAKTEALQHFEVVQGEELIESVAKRTPAGRLVTPKDVAQLVAFLCSPAANMIRGQVILIDGGYTLME
jgi:enoyl-[acyl-carrier protein] reductase III